MGHRIVVGYISKYGNSFGGCSVVNELIMDPHSWMLEYETSFDFCIGTLFILAWLVGDLFALSLISYRPSNSTT